MIRTGYNPTAAPVVVDAAGHMIGGGEWGTYESTEDAAKAAIDAGTLLDVDADIDKSSNPSAAAQVAFKRTKEIKERAEKAKKVEKADLREAAVEADLIEETADPHLPELRVTVAEATHVPLPESKSKSKRTRTQED